MSVELFHALEQLEKERGIEKDILIEAIESALISAYKKNFGTSQNVKVNIDRSSGDVKVYAQKEVVDEPISDFTEVAYEIAQKIKPGCEMSDIIEVEITPKRFGRIAAQTAKQVVMQKIRDAEKNIIYDMYAEKVDDIVSGVIGRFEKRNVIINLGRTEAIMPPGEQTPNEEYRHHDRIKAYLLEVKKTNKNPQIRVSRTHPGLVKRLLEFEVPEISQGIVEIKAIAREAGSRTKIAIFSRDENIDAVGACVGQKGGRIRAIVDELRGEMIDIIKWSSDPIEYISSSLSPAKVVRVDINEIEKIARVVVPDFQLSLAIGKEGQNARLAAKLTGWKIDIKSESQLRATIEQELLNYSGNYIDNEDEIDTDEYDADVDAEEYIEDDTMGYETDENYFEEDDIEESQDVDNKID